MLGAILEVEMSKKYTPLWREAHVQVNMYKDTNFGALLEVEMSKSARRCGPKHISKSKVEKKLTGTEHFWTFTCCFAWPAQGIVHLVKSKQNLRVL